MASAMFTQFRRGLNGDADVSRGEVRRQCLGYAMAVAVASAVRRHRCCLCRCCCCLLRQRQD